MNWPRFSEPAQDGVPFTTDEHPVLADPEDEDEMDYPLATEGMTPTRVTQEAAWNRFVHHTIAESVRQCRWLGKQDHSAVLGGEVPKGGAQRAKYQNGLTSYAWIFHGSKGVIRFVEMCDSVGLDPDFIRENTAALCPPTEDIKTLVRLFQAGKLLSSM